MQTNEILEMRNSMKINFINHMRASKRPLPQTVQLYDNFHRDIKDPKPMIFKVKDKTLDWGKVNALEKDKLAPESNVIIDLLNLDMQEISK
jgi:hypothetical protein